MGKLISTHTGARWTGSQPSSKRRGDGRPGSAGLTSGSGDVISYGPARDNTAVARRILTRRIPKAKIT
jgi:hypothetical protein